MLTGKEKKTRWIMGALGIAMVMLMALPSTGLTFDCLQAEPNSMADLDRDGYPDYEECWGMEYMAIDVTGNQVVRTFPGRNAWMEDPTMPREMYLDPETPDVFMFIQYDDLNNESYLRPLNNLFLLMANQVQVGGLSLNGHLMEDFPLELIMDPRTGQKAMFIVEDSTPMDSDVLGVAPQGPVTLPGVNAVVYTGAIEQAVIRTYTDNGIQPPPNDNDETPVADYIFKLIENTIVHESGHLLDLAEIFTRKGVRLIHFPQIGVMMDAEVEVTIKKGKVTWTFPEVWDPTSQELFELNRVDGT